MRKSLSYKFTVFATSLLMLCYAVSTSYYTVSVVDQTDTVARRDYCCLEHVRWVYHLPLWTSQSLVMCHCCSIRVVGNVTEMYLTSYGLQQSRSRTTPVHSTEAYQCSRKRVQKLKKRKKSCVLILKKRTLKRKKRTYSVTGHLITQPLITQLPEVSNG